jgi:hypothetical protein
MAHTLRQALAASSHAISNSEALEFVAKMFGERDWNTLAAAVAAAEAEPQKPGGLAGAFPDQAALDALARAIGKESWDALVAAVRSEGRPAGPFAPQGSPPGLLGPARASDPGASFSGSLEATLHRAVSLATARKHEYTTLEHLLLALTSDTDAAAVMDACGADQAQLVDSVTAHLDNGLGSIATQSGEGPVPTVAFHRVIQRSVIHVRSSGRSEVTGANVLVAIFSERESHAARLLAAQGMNRYDAVNFIAHGVRKAGGRAA